MRLEPRAHPPLWLLVGAPVAAVVGALALAAVPLRLAGADLAGAYRQMAFASFGSWFALAETMTRATPLILTGLAVAVAFRARLWNIGAEGQLYLGAIVAVALGSGALHLPAPVLLPLIMLGAATAGALFMLGPTLLKVRLGVDEVVTTLLFWGLFVTSRYGSAWNFLISRWRCGCRMRLGLSSTMITRSSDSSSMRRSLAGTSTGSPSDFSWSTRWLLVKKPSTSC